MNTTDLNALEKVIEAAFDNRDTVDDCDQG